VSGTVIQVSAGRGGVPNTAIAEARLTDSGVAGDAWRYPFHGGRRRSILLVTAEGIEALIAEGFPLFPGALGENLTTRGLDRRAIRLGQHVRVGEAEIAITEIRMPCATLDVYGRGVQAAMYDVRVQNSDATSARWGLSGFYASVVRPGIVRPGDPAILLE